jgi:hypothetical protein
MFEESCVCFKADLRFAVPRFQRPSHKVLKVCAWLSLLERVSHFLIMDLRVQHESIAAPELFYIGI